MLASKYKKKSGYVLDCPVRTRTYIHYKRQFVKEDLSSTAIEYQKSVNMLWNIVRLIPTARWRIICIVSSSGRWLGRIYIMILFHPSSAARTKRDHIKSIVIYGCQIQINRKPTQKTCYDFSNPVLYASVIFATAKTTVRKYDI